MIVPTKTKKDIYNIVRSCAPFWAPVICTSPFPHPFGTNGARAQHFFQIAFNNVSWVLTMVPKNYCLLECDVVQSGMYVLTSHNAVCNIHTPVYLSL